MNKILAAIAVTVSFSCGAFAGGLDELKTIMGSEAVDSLIVPAVGAPEVDVNSGTSRKFVARTARQLRRVLKFYGIEAKVRVTRIEGVGPVLSVNFAIQNDYDRFDDMLSPDGHYNGVLVAAHVDSSVELPATSMAQMYGVDLNSKPGYKFAVRSAKQLRKALKFYDIDAKVSVYTLIEVGPILNVEFAAQDSHKRFYNILAPNGFYNGCLVSYS